MSFRSIQAVLANGGTVILDGATGTELERRGAVMSDETWCAPATLTHGAILKSVHTDYIAAGADLITANTYGSSPFLLDHYGKLDDLAVIDRRAVEIAREAANESGRDIAVAGSFSVMRPNIKGTDDTDMNVVWTERRAREILRQKAEGLAEAGADLIAMEMLRDCDYSLWATEAAIATGLPVFAGIATVRGPDGDLRANTRSEFSLDDVVRAVSNTGVTACLIMHSSVNDIADALEVLRTHWAGPIGAYPESGYFEMPNWRFVDVIEPAALVTAALGWRQQGATLFGGCCGTGPGHVAALAGALGKR